MSDENNTGTEDSNSQGNNQTEGTGSQKTQTNEEQKTETTETSSSDLEDQLIQEKQKELKLIQEKNKQLEQSLKGKSTFIPDKNPEEKIKDECNNFLESTGMKI